MRPQHTNGSPSETDRAAKLTKRQYVRFAFYKLDPLWRRLPADKQAAHKRELRDTIEGFNKRMLLRPYSLMGTRADAEILLWQIAETPMHFQELATAIMRTGMGAYLNMVYSYFSQTKRSIYQIRDNPADDEERLIIQPSEAKYLFVYPFIKSRDWYQLSFHARQGMMDEHIVVGREFPSVKLNTTYSFGVDDYEFIVAFETDEPSDFLDLVQKLRETEVSRYTVQDTPLFNCINMRLIEALDALGGPPVAEPVIQRNSMKHGRMLAHSASLAPVLPKWFIWKANRSPCLM
jgi:chlorite dismutase